MTISMRKKHALNKFWTVFYIQLCLTASLYASDNLSSGEIFNLYRQGKVEILNNYLSLKVNSLQTPSDFLLQALLTSDAEQAVRLFEDLFRASNIDDTLRVIVWHQLYGYYLLLNMSDKAAETLRQLERHPELGCLLFNEGKYPKITTPSSSGVQLEQKKSTMKYAIQIGAFSVRDRAESLVSSIQAKNLTAEIHPIESSGKRLFAVWVGNFSSEEEARQFGLVQYGVEGVDFKIARKWASRP